MTLVAEDVRLSRTFDFRERAQLTLIGEVFNLFNIANLSGRDGDVTDPGFGQPRSRLTQVFRSGGTRISIRGAPQILVFDVIVHVIDCPFQLAAKIGRRYTQRRYELSQVRALHDLRNMEVLRWRTCAS
jgi:hypothetical protein